jgi:hypothetical protein
MLSAVPKVWFAATVILLRRDRDALPVEDHGHVLFAGGEVL